MTRSTRWLVNALLAFLLIAGLAVGNFQLNEHWKCQLRTGPNPTYGLPPGPLDFNQDGVVEDYEELAHDYERMSNNRRFNYRDASGLACARGWFY